MDKFQPIMHKSLLTLIISIVLPAIALAEKQLAPATKFIRVDRSEQQVKLQTAVTRYSKGDTHINLIGAVHIADKTYYQQLNKSFASYPVLLFEMIGGEALGQGRPLAEKGENQPTALAFLNTMFDTMQSLLALSSQKEHIDYSAKNFLHADLTIKEFTQLQEQRKESLLSFAIKQSLQEDPANQPSSLKLIFALLSRNPDKLKLQLVDTLGKGDNQMAAMAGDNVIINDRNEKCLAVMQSQIDLGIKTIGIFYGAAHYPDMEKRLLKQGYTKTQQSWLDAWVIPAQKPALP